MRERVCEKLNIFLWRVYNLTQYETKCLWAAKNVLLKRVKFNTEEDIKGFGAAKHVLLKSVKFNAVWDKVFVSS